MTGIVVPGKLYGVMAAGRPAIFVGPEHCETADTIRDAGCGITIAPGDADGLVAALSAPRLQPESRSPHGRKGTIGVPHAARPKTLLRPVARADRRTGRSARKADRQSRPRRRASAHVDRCGGRAPCHTVSVSRTLAIVPSTATTAFFANVRVNAMRSTTLSSLP